MFIRKYPMLLCLIALAVFTLFLHFQRNSLKVESLLNASQPLHVEEEQVQEPKESISFLSKLKEPKNTKCSTIFQNVSFQSLQGWSTPACKKKQYNSADLHTCLQKGNRPIAIAGDSRMRQLYKTLLNLIRNERDDNLKDAFHRDDVFIYSKTVQIQFFWLKVADDIATNRITSWLQMNPEERPEIFVFGMGPWYLAYEAEQDAAVGQKFLPEYKNAFQNLSRLLNELDKHTPVIWLEQGPADYLRNGAKKNSLYTMEQYNAVSEAILNGTRVTYWRSAYDAAYLFYNDSRDAVHFSMAVTDLFLDILLNFYCNSKMKVNDEYCCSSTISTTPNTTVGYQVSAPLTDSYLFDFCILFLVITSSIYLWVREADKPLSNKISLALSVLSFMVIILLCHALERWAVVPAEGKQYSLARFCLPVGTIVLLACYTYGTAKLPTILNRDQTDEWKGWMQLVIVIYHVTGSSRELVIYMYLRLIVSSYLVLNGYGHFMFYIHGGRLWSSRLLQVIIRMNLLCAILCIVMKQPYQFYYFVPLVTFWYLFVSAILALPPRVTAESLKGSSTSYLLLLVKLLAAVCLITALHSSETFFESVFSIPYLRALFVYTDGSLHFWRFQWSLDRFSAIFGILLGIATNAMMQRSFQVSKWISLPLGAAALLGLIVPATLGLHCESKQKCNELHSFIFFIPVVSFIYLRNITETVRQRYSWLMAWFGRMSLELFLLQFHLWMCNDTQQVLRILPWPLVNEAFLALTLITASSILQKATETLAALVSPAMLSRKISPDA